MKHYLLLILLFFACWGMKGEAQKVDAFHYKKVDSLIMYKNAEIIIYKQNGKPKKDTLYFNKMRGAVNIENAGTVDVRGYEELPEKPK